MVSLDGRISATLPSPWRMRARIVRLWRAERWLRRLAPGAATEIPASLEELRRARIAQIREMSRLRHILYEEVSATPPPPAPPNPEPALLPRDDA